MVVRPADGRRNYQLFDGKTQNCMMPGEYMRHDLAGCGLKTGEIGPYEILEIIGRGTMGSVYRCRDPQTRGDVAVKVLSPEEGIVESMRVARNQFIFGARELKRFNHPRIVSTMHVDEVDGIPFYAMEYLPISLADELRPGGASQNPDGRMPVETAIRITKEVLEGLAFFNENRRVHWDINPRNILLTKSKNAKLTDFSIARIAPKTSLTRTGYLVGDPEFCAPEHNDIRFADHRADLYSVGMVMYLMVTGYHPFMTRFADPGYLVEGLPQEFDDIFRTATDLDPERRFQRADQMLEAVKGAASAHANVSAMTSHPLVYLPKYRLRRDPMTISDDELRNALLQDDHEEKLVCIDNDFEDNKDGTITDHATGLMWKLPDKKEYLTYNGANKHVAQLNKKWFGGHNDWRLPTVDELLSLASPKDVDIAPLFNNILQHDEWWTSDVCSPGVAWSVSYLGVDGVYIDSERTGVYNDILALRSLL